LSGEAVVSEVLIKNVQEVFRKIRNTARFLLSNVYDFDVTVDALAYEQLRVIDQYALYELLQFYNKSIEAYNAYNFTALFHLFADYSATHLSAFYLDIVKDRLYVEKADGHARRSAQTVCFYILDVMTKLMANIVIYGRTNFCHYQKIKSSIHLQDFPDLTPCSIF
jgi:isoleucyl-tRNA synthetase